MIFFEKIDTSVGSNEHDLRADKPTSEVKKKKKRRKKNKKDNKMTKRDKKETRTNRI